MRRMPSNAPADRSLRVLGRPSARARAIVAALGLTLVCGGFEAQIASPAAAQQAKPRVAKPYRKKPMRAPQRRAPRDDSFDYLKDPESLPFGSTVWWRAMDMRNRGGFGGDH